MLMVDDAALEDFTGLTDVKEEQKNAVVIGLAPNMFNYSELNKAFRWAYLQHSNLLVGPTSVARDWSYSGQWVTWLQCLGMCQLVVLKMGNNVLEEPDGSVLGVEANFYTDIE